MVVTDEKGGKGGERGRRKGGKSKCTQIYTAYRRRRTAFNGNLLPHPLSGHKCDLPAQVCWCCECTHIYTAYRRRRTLSPCLVSHLLLCFAEARPLLVNRRAFHNIDGWSIMIVTNGNLFYHPLQVTSATFQFRPHGLSQKSPPLVPLWYRCCLREAVWSTIWLAKLADKSSEKCTYIYLCVHMYGAVIITQSVPHRRS